MVRIEHLQSSTQIIDLDGIRVLTDPWLTPGEYFGSWFHYPPFDVDAISSLKYDFIYVSHIHPDHCSENTFKLLDVSVPVLIANFKDKFLKFKIESFGFTVIEISHAVPFYFNDLSFIEIFLSDNCDPKLCGSYFGCRNGVSDLGFPRSIDSLALFGAGDIKVLNTNDCPYDLTSRVVVENPKLCDVDFLLVGYAGAGPFPQCFSLSSDRLIDAMETKRNKFLTDAKKYIDLINPKFFGPFAGTYVLGGEFVPLNEARGVPTLVEAVRFLDDVCSENSTGVLLEQGCVFNVTNRCFDRRADTCKLTLEEYLDEISALGFDYGTECFDACNQEHLDLLFVAWSRFNAKAMSFGVVNAIPHCFKIDECFIRFSIDEPAHIVSEIDFSKFDVIEVDPRLFLRLLKGPRYAHWNNAEIGSHLKFFRSSSGFDRGFNFAMNFFHA